MFTWVLKNQDTGEQESIFDPRGWEDIKFTHNRSEKWDGVFFNFSQSLEFACKGGGKEMIDAAFDLKGPEANVTLDITYGCDSQARTINTKLDFSTYTQQYRGGKLYSILDVHKIGITQVVQNRSGTDVDILPGDDGKIYSLDGTLLNRYGDLLVNMHSKKIRQESEWSSVYHGCCFHLVTSGLKAFTITPTTDIVKGDITDTAETESACKFFINAENVINSASIVNTRGNDILTEPQEASVTWDFKGQITFTTYDVTPIPTVCNDDTCGTGPIDPTVLYDSIDIALRLYFGNPDSTDINEASQCGGNPINEDGIKYIDLATASGTGAGGVNVEGFNMSGNQDIIINPGDKIWLLWVIDFNLNSICDMKIEFTYQESLLNILIDSQAASTTCRMLPIHEAWSRVCEVITDQTLAFKSEFFGRTNSQGISYNNNGYASFTGITDGLRIRGFNKVVTDTELELGETKKGIITNLDDFYDACNTIWGIGLAIENHNGVEVLRAEEKKYFYSDTVVLQLDDVPNIEMRLLTERAYSGVEIGYKQWKPELKNGLDEPNTIARWAFTKIKSLDNVISFISPFIAGMYAIETTRRKNIIFKTTDDSRYDDDIFIVALNRTTNGKDWRYGAPTNMTTAEKNENIPVVSETTGSYNSLIDPDSAYNLRFNLMSCFARLANQFTTALTKDYPQPIDYTYFEGNGQMEFNYTELPGYPGDWIGRETHNVQNTTIRDPSLGRLMRRPFPIVLPEQYTFTYPLSFTQYIDILDNPYGKIRFSGDGVTYFEGWITTLEYQIKNGMTNFTIIRKNPDYSEFNPEFLIP